MPILGAEMARPLGVRWWRQLLLSDADRSGGHLMRIEVDRPRCEGLGMCEAMAPDFFAVGDDGTVDVVSTNPAEKHRRDVWAAVDSCPVLALALLD